MFVSKRPIFGIALSLVISFPALAGNAPLSTIESLVHSRAYGLALVEAKRLGSDAGSYWEGYCLRRLGQDPLKAFGRVPKHSRYYRQACIERARFLRTQGQYQASAELLEEAASLGADSQLTRELAELWSLAGAYYRAAELYSKLSSQMPDLLYPLAWCYTKMDNYPKAMLVWQEALAKSPGHPMTRDAYIGLANSYLRLKKPFKAAEYFRKVGEVDRAAFLEGEGYAQNGQYSTALSHYKSARGSWIEPSAYGVAYTQWKLGRLAEAIKSFNHYLTQYPQGMLYPDALYGYARVLEANGDLPQAKDAYLKLANTRNREKALYELCGLAFAQEAYPEAIKWARLLTDEFTKSPLVPAATWALAESALANAEYSSAIEAYDRLAQQPDRLEFLKNRTEELNYRLGIAYFRAEKYQQAVEILAKCQSDDALFWRAEAAYQLGKTPVGYYSEYLRKFPNGGHAGEAYYGQAWCYYRDARLADAQDSFRQAADRLVHPKLKQDSLERLSEVATRLGHWKEAEKAYQDLEALLQGEDAQEARFQRAQCLSRQGRQDEALALFESYADANGSKRHNALSMVGHIHVNAGRHQQAIPYFEKISQSQTATAQDRLDAAYMIAACYFNLGNSQAACEVYAKLLAEPGLEETSRTEIQQLMAQARIKTGDLSIARTIAQESSASWKVSLLDEIAQAYAAKPDPAEALKTLELLPPSPERKFLAANCHQAMGDATRSVEILLGLSRDRHAYQEKSLYLLGEYYRQQRQVKDAAWAFNRQYSLYPSTMSVQVGLDTAKLAIEQKEPAIAKEIYRTVANTQPKTPSARTAWLGLGELEYSSKRFNEAATAYRKAEASATPKTAPAAQARYWMGASLVGAAKYEEAIKELELLKQNPQARIWLPLAWLKQGEACEFLRRFTQAKAYYRRVLQQGTPADRSEAARRIDWIDKNIKGVS